MSKLLVKCPIKTVHIINSENVPCESLSAALSAAGFVVTTEDDEILNIDGVNQLPIDVAILVPPCSEIEFLRFGASMGADQLSFIFEPPQVGEHAIDESDDGAMIPVDTSLLRLGLRRVTHQQFYFRKLSSLVRKLLSIERLPRSGDVWRDPSSEERIELMTRLEDRDCWIALGLEYKQPHARLDPFVMTSDCLLDRYVFERQALKK